MKKIHQFLSSIKRNAHKRKSVPFSAWRCIYMLSECLNQSALIACLGWNPGQHSTPLGGRLKKTRWPDKYTKVAGQRADEACVFTDKSCWLAGELMCVVSIANIHWSEQAPCVVKTTIPRPSIPSPAHILQINTAGGWVWWRPCKWTEEGLFRSRDDSSKWLPGTQ